MKIENVPQDNKCLEATSLRDLYYAVDSDGQYTSAPSVGWNVKNEALELAWSAVREEAESVRQEVVEGRKSPLAYHIKMSMLDIGMLSSYSGIARRTVKKHLRPEEFKRLDGETLDRYARAMNITVEELKKI